MNIKPICPNCHKHFQDPLGRESITLSILHGYNTLAFECVNCRLDFRLDLHIDIAKVGPINDNREPE